MLKATLRIDFYELVFPILRCKTLEKNTQGLWTLSLRFFPQTPLLQKDLDLQPKPIWTQQEEEHGIYPTLSPNYLKIRNKVKVERRDIHVERDIDIDMGANIESIWFWIGFCYSLVKRKVSREKEKEKIEWKQIKPHLGWCLMEWDYNELGPNDTCFK